MICPRCGAEYRQGFTKCADCELDLVPGRPGAALARFLSDTRTDDRSEGDGALDQNDDPFCSFWKGTDARICTELCTVLDEAGIPHKTIRRQDHLFNFADRVPYEVGVPASLYEKAELAIKEAFGTDQETGEEAVPLLPPPDRDPADFEEELYDAMQDANEWLGPRYPEDATVEVWSGGEMDAREMIEMSLKENDVMTRREVSEGVVKILVLPEDQERAKEIVREVVEGRPPE